MREHFTGREDIAERIEFHITALQEVKSECRCSSAERYRSGADSFDREGLGGLHWPWLRPQVRSLGCPPSEDSRTRFHPSWSGICKGRQSSARRRYRSAEEHQHSDFTSWRAVMW